MTQEQIPQKQPPQKQPLQEQILQNQIPQEQVAQKETEKMQEWSSPIPLDPRYFTGTGTLRMLPGDEHTSVGLVHFDAGCINHWHEHPLTQVLVVTEGEGLYQEKGKAARLLHPGDVVVVPAHTQHWHGAVNNAAMEHVAITLKADNSDTVYWGEPVSAESYQTACASVAAARSTSPRSTATKQSDAQHDNPLSSWHVTAGRDSLGDFAPAFAHFNDDVLFGEVWSREKEFSPRDRSLVTVTALVASGITGGPLEHHLRRAQANGVTQQEIAEALTQIAFYAGWPKAWNAFNLATKIWQERSTR